jgi:hypothetical protein
MVSDEFLYWEERVEMVNVELVARIEKVVRTAYGNPMFDVWIYVDSCSEISEWYVSIFKKYFDNYIHAKDEQLIRDYGWACGHTVQSIGDMDIEDIVRILNKYVKIQVGDFGNWCGDVCLRMPSPDDEDIDPSF